MMIKLPLRSLRGRIKLPPMRLTLMLCRRGGRQHGWRDAANQQDWPAPADEQQILAEVMLERFARDSLDWGQHNLLT